MWLEVKTVEEIKPGQTFKVEGIGWTVVKVAGFDMDHGSVIFHHPLTGLPVLGGNLGEENGRRIYKKVNPPNTEETFFLIDVELSDPIDERVHHAMALRGTSKYRLFNSNGYYIDSVDQSEIIDYKPASLEVIDF